MSSIFHSDQESTMLKASLKSVKWGVSSWRSMPFAKVSNSIHKFDPMYVTDLTPDMMDGKIFKD